MAFTAQDVKALREMTGAGMMECKKALTHTDGDMDKAATYLREQGISIAAKKSSRLASEGAVSAFVTDDGLTGALVEVNCESDFVAIGEEFVALARNIAKHVAKANPKDVDTCLDQKYDNTCTIRDMINNATAKIGEKISLRRFDRYQIKTGRIEPYLHMGGKRGVLLVAETSKLIIDEEFGATCHDIAMHIAALSPKYVCSCNVPAEETQNEKAIIRAQIVNNPKDASKPAAVIDKMIDGRISKFFKETCLIEQEFVKDPGRSVGEVVKDMAKKQAAEIKITAFSLFVMGEGLEKKNEDFAAEIAKLSGN